MFSILIPTFNNLDYLKICIESLRKNSNFDHQIIVHVNEGSDGTLEYVKGSHKWGLQPPKGEFHSPEDYKLELKKFAHKKNKKIEINYVEVPAGGVAFHHGYTWHGSGTNNTKNHRRVIVSHCIPFNAKFHPTNTGGTGKIYRKYKKNNSNELNDKFFPLIWKRN